MNNENKKKYSCDDCKWNFVCKDNSGGKCEEFTLDRIMSNTFTDKAIKSNRRIFNMNYYEHLSEWEDV